MIDRKTIKELKLGNPAALKEVFQLLYPRLKVYCNLFIRNEDQVQDIIQDSFITLWEKRDSIIVDKSIESYIFIIVRNRCLNFLKKQKIDSNIIDFDSINIEQLQYLYQLDFTEKEDRSIEELLIESLREAVDELPDKMKQVFIKCKVEGKKQKEVAESLGISIKMVEKHISKSKQKIREKLIKQYPELIVLITFLIEEINI